MCSEDFVNDKTNRNYEWTQERNKTYFSILYKFVLYSIQFKFKRKPNMAKKFNKNAVKQLFLYKIKGVEICSFQL